MMTEAHPDVAAGSSNRYQSWEVVDPEKWVPHGYACVRVDSRGAGRSPGFLDCYSPRETQDMYACVEWAAAQPWSSGKVGLNGVSYYAINQWEVASLQPPHLAAMCAWEGAADFYRDMCYHGGIRSTFFASWYPRQVTNVQHGVGERGARSRITGELVAGPETLSDEELARNRADLGADVRAHPLDDGWHRSRSADWDRIDVPLLSCCNWGGHGLHARGNFEAFVRARSAQKWLEVHGLGRAAAGAARGPAAGRALRAARRARVAARAHALGASLPRRGRPTRLAAAGAGGERRVRRPRRRCHVLARAVRARDGDHRTGRRCCRTGPTTRTTRCSRSSRARSTSSTSRCGRRASSLRRDTAWH